MLQTLYDALKENPKATYAYGGFDFGLGRFKALPWSGNRLREIELHSHFGAHPPRGFHRL